MVLWGGFGEGKAYAVEADTFQPDFTHELCGPDAVLMLLELGSPEPGGCGEFVEFEEGIGRVHSEGRCGLVRHTSGLACISDSR